MKRSLSTWGAAGALLFSAGANSATNTVAVSNASAAASATASTGLQLAGVFGEHMVLQRYAPIPVWGTAGPGERVRVSWRGTTRTTRAGPDGRWQLRLPAAPAGGPHRLTVQARQTVVLNDVLVGDVWLCSGQSNMEWTVAQSQDAAHELAAANHPTIRHLRVPRRASLQPQYDMAPAQWQPASPATVGGFGAVPYFFAQHLQQALATAARPAGKRGAVPAAPVPIGLIHASWGGAHIETWTSPRAALADPVLAPTLQAMPAAAAAFAERHRKQLLEVVRRWQGDLALAAPADAERVKAEWSAPGLDDSNWRTLNAPQIWEEQGLPNFDGTLWYRRQVQLTPEQAAGDAQLHLGAIDDCDETWVNGQRVGGQCVWDALRQYRVPASVLRSGSNVIAVRVLDTGGAGGFHGPASGMRLETVAGTLPLSGTWKARVEAPLTKTEPGVNDLPTLLFNGMLQPLLPVRLRGVLWYQGESNVPRAARYVHDFQNLITDWRAQWQQPTLPFLYVQLASFLPLAKNTHAGSTWAELRDAQRQALSLPATGMVVATDLGDANDIHPRNKRPVGERLAGLALRVAHGRQDIVADGPVLHSQHALADGRLELRFNDGPPGSALAVRGGGEAVVGFAVAGADGQFVPAQAVVRGQSVVVWSDQVAQPLAVRYGWVDNPEQANLVNRAGLPASPFRTDRAPWLSEGGRPPF